MYDIPAVHLSVSLSVCIVLLSPESAFYTCDFLKT